MEEIGIGRGYALVAETGSWESSVEAGILRRSMPTMGTLANVSVFGVHPERARHAVEAAFAEIRLVERLMTTHDPSSQLSRVNERSGSDAPRVDGRVLDVARMAVEWSRATDGRFDATTLPLVRAWGLRNPDEYVSDPDVLEEARGLVDWRGVVVEGDRLGLARAGQGLDFGGIGKGYAVDRAVALMRDAFGIEHALVEIGGDLYALGRPKDRAGWRIGLQDPLGKGILAVMEVADLAVATSGNYAHRQADASRPDWGDSMDVATGRPRAAALSTTVVAPTCADADAASTHLFVAGGRPGPGPAARGIRALHLLANTPEGIEYEACEGFPELETE